jgi:hypothetical protein
MNAYGPEGANDYSPGCQPGVHMINRINSEGVTEAKDICRSFGACGYGVLSPPGFTPGAIFFASFGGIKMKAEETKIISMLLCIIARVWSFVYPKRITQTLELGITASRSFYLACYSVWHQ